MKISPLNPAIAPATLEAEPGKLQIDLQRTGVVVIDMQNAFVSKGGLLNLLGEDVSKTPKLVKDINSIIRAAKARKMPVIYVVHYHSPDLRESGGPNAGYWYKVHLDGLARTEWADKCYVQGTWGAEIVKGLEYKKDDVLVVKPRFSAFFGTDLDSILKTANLKYLAFVGVATNICVETSIRDAANLDYFPIIVSDATIAIGPQYMQDAALYNIKECFGWVTSTRKLLKALK